MFGFIYQMEGWTTRLRMQASPRELWMTHPQERPRIQLAEIIRLIPENQENDFLKSFLSKDT